MPVTHRRTATKLLRLRPAEVADITARAETCGLKPARFIRETALGAIPRARHDAAVDAVTGDLARIGRCLDELARLEASQRTRSLSGSVPSSTDSGL